MVSVRRRCGRHEDSPGQGFRKLEVPRRGRRACYFQARGSEARETEMLVTRAPQVGILGALASCKATQWRTDMKVIGIALLATLVWAGCDDKKTENVQSPANTTPISKDAPKTAA